MQMQTGGHAGRKALSGDRTLVVHSTWVVSHTPDTAESEQEGLAFEAQGLDRSLVVRCAAVCVSMPQWLCVVVMMMLP